ncbi:MAG TPA: glycosyltransferase family 39 protein [Anaerolineales bacterium]|nr:glycosyltransferase family 39 protein [Anaerolineales bacterium]
MNTTSAAHRSFFSPRPLLIFTLVLLFGLGFGIRLYQLTNLPLDFQPTRQLLSMLKARGMYYAAAGAPDIAPWQRQMAIQQWKTRADVEPSILENIVAFTYRFTGEHFWIARLYSSLFWVIGGIFLFLLVRDLISPDGAVIAAAYYLFFPYAVIASRSFQPDPFMVMSILSFWWAFQRWISRTSDASPIGKGVGAKGWLWAIAAGLFGGLAILIKFSAAFFVIGAALGLGLGKNPWRDLIRSPQAWVMALLGILPAAAYLYDGLILNNFLRQQFGGRFFPSLLVSPINYINWESQAALAAGGLAIMLGLLGLFFVRDRSARFFLYGLWGMYILYGLYFDYHIATHDYYQLPFIPIVAVSLAPLADWFLARLAELSAGRRLRMAALVFLAFGLFSALWDVRNTLKSVDYRPQAAMWAEIGDRLGHGPGVVALTQDYGQRLNYWGWQNADIWPNSGDIDYHELRGASFNSTRNFVRMTSGKNFFLVTDFSELDRQAALKQSLSVFPVYAQGAGYVIYDLRNPPPP